MPDNIFVQIVSKWRRGGWILLVVVENHRNIGAVNYGFELFHWLPWPSPAFPDLAVFSVLCRWSSAFSFSPRTLCQNIVLRVQMCAVFSASFNSLYNVLYNVTMITFSEQFKVFSVHLVSSVECLERQELLQNEPMLLVISPPPRNASTKNNYRLFLFWLVICFLVI